MQNSILPQGLPPRKPWYKQKKWRWYVIIGLIVFHLLMFWGSFKWIQQYF